jgi:hypothetical protein
MEGLREAPVHTVDEAMRLIQLPSQRTLPLAMNLTAHV